MAVSDLNLEEKFAERLAKLRIDKGVSARDMSLSLGQGAGYINNIENKNNLPSMTSFFYICEYFGITPQEFFDYDNESPALTKELFEAIKKLDYMETTHVLDIVKDINKKFR